MKVFGIRHHGPHSARRLLAALDAYAPEIVLLEAPADSAPELAELAHPGLRPPAALVLYDAKNIERAAFYPFAEFSPEYQAIRWADRHDLEARPIDLPARHFLVAEDDPPLQLFPTAAEPEEPSAYPGKSQRELAETLRRDPLSLLAELAGYPDSESWWDATLERGDRDAEAVFQVLLESIGALREAYPEASNEENERREAYMRQEIRKARKEGFARIAVVVGAWHGPAVNDVDAHKVSRDKALLRGLPKVKIARAWVPWSFPRLARSGGYGAGVHSPNWYQALFDHPREATVHWMTAAAQLLRAEGFDASPAMASEAVGLAQALTALRGHERPGITELEAAARGTLAAGRPERLALIHDRLTIGTATGHVPADVTTVPLLEDLRRALKSTRMTKYWEETGQHYLKATKANPRGGIDLRADNDLRKSHLLHRLNLLGVRWGQLQERGEEAISSFKEQWLLEWQPEFSLLIIERSSYGNTVRHAAAAHAVERATALRMVDKLATLTLDCLRAALPETVAELMTLLRTRAAETTDAITLLMTLPTLITTSRYGDSRKTDTTALVLVIDELLPRLVAALPAAVSNVDDERATDILNHLAAANYAVAQLDRAELSDLWTAGLERLARHGGSHPLLVGHAVRLLYDRKVLSVEEAVNWFHRAVSGGNAALEIAHWLGGFLYGSGQLLLHHAPLWTLVDDWVKNLGWEDFEQILPQLRRTFADFSHYDRKKLMSLVRTEKRADNLGADAGAGHTTEAGTDDELIAALLQWI